MVVLQIIDSLHRGGAQKVVLDIVRALRSHKHIVCYWANETDLQCEFEAEDVLLIRIPFTDIRSFFKTRSFLMEVIEQYHPNIIHTHMFVPNMLARMVPKQFALFCTYHGEVFQRGGIKGLATRLIERFSLHRSDELIAVSNHVKTYIRKKLATNRTINVVYNFGKKSHPVSKNFSKLPIKLIATSNNQPYKNYPLLLYVMAELSNQPLTLDIYGGNMEPLIKQARELGISNIRFCGVVRDVTEKFEDYSAFVITSHSGEGFSLALLEAMSAGMPIICTDIPQFKEATGESSIVFENLNGNDLVEKLQTIIENPRDLGRLAELSHAQSFLFSQERFVKTIVELYDRYDKTG